MSHKLPLTSHQHRSGNVKWNEFYRGVHSPSNESRLSSRRQQAAATSYSEETRLDGLLHIRGPSGPYMTATNDKVSGRS